LQFRILSAYIGSQGEKKSRTDYKKKEEEYTHPPWFSDLDSTLEAQPTGHSWGGGEKRKKIKRKKKKGGRENPDFLFGFYPINAGLQKRGGGRLLEEK